MKQLILPIALKDKLLNSVHDQVGHQADEKTTALARSMCYWMGMVKNVAEYCNRCERCTLAKAGKKLHPTIGSLRATKALEVLAMDFTVLEPGAGGIENMLVLTDVFTQLTQTIPTRYQKERTIARVLVRDWFVWFGMPRRLHSDQGRNFESKIIQNFA